MLIFDSSNPMYTATANNMSVFFGKNVVGAPVPEVTLVGSTHITAVPVTRATMNVITPVQAAVVLSGVVADDTVTINGVTYVAKASGATGNQFNVGANDAEAAANLAAVFNTNQKQGAGPVFMPSQHGKMTVQSVVTGSGAVGATVTTQVSIDGLLWFTHPSLSPQALSGTATAGAISAQISAYPFVRASVASLTGTSAVVKVSVATTMA